MGNIKRGLVFAGVGMLLSCCVQAAKPGNIIGVVNINRVLENSSHTDEARSDIKAKFADRFKLLIKTGKKIESDLKDFRKDRPTLTNTEIADHEKDLSNRSQKLMEARSKYQKEVDAEQANLQNKLISNLNRVVERLAVAKSLILVIPENYTLYALPTLDITDEVAREYEKSAG